MKLRDYEQHYMERIRDIFLDHNNNPNYRFKQHAAFIHAACNLTNSSRMKKFKLKFVEKWLDKNPPLPLCVKKAQVVTMPFMR